jgi:hypothetical protein
MHWQLTLQQGAKEEVHPRRDGGIYVKLDDPDI